MKQDNSGTTISLGEACSKIGTQRGAPGLATPADTAAPWLAQRSVEEVDKAVLSRASQHGVELRVRYEGRYPTGPNGEKLGSYMLAVGCEVEGGEIARQTMLADLVNFMAPAEQRNVEAWLAELSVIVARRPQESVDEAIRLQAYASRLRAFPADVARQALLGRSWQFWPTWAELEAECKRLAGPRSAMFTALSRPDDRRQIAAPEPDPEEVEEIRARRDVLMAELQSALKAQEKRERRPHWSETAAPDNPRWDELRRIRAANPLMNPEHAE